MAVMMETSSGASPAAMGSTVSGPIVASPVSSWMISPQAPPSNPTVLSSCNGSRQQQWTLKGGDRGA
jgi:hypothetical protein